jgi:exopolysaccharide biosynthesis polyprenyl glycosylphosphotransferase
MKRFLLLLLDILALYASLAFVLAFRYRNNFSEQWDIHFLPFSIIFILWILVFYIINLYETSSLRNTVNFYNNLIRAIVTSAIISTTFFYLIPFFNITPRMNLFLFILIFSGLELLSRYIFNSIAESKFKKPIIIMGRNPQSLELAQFIETNPQLGFKLKHVIDITKRTQDIDRIIKKEKINTVIISPDAYQNNNIIDTFYKTLEYKVTFRNLSSFYEQTTGRVPLGAINQVWFLENLTEGAKNYYEGAKRFFDVVFALILGIITLIFYPVFILLVKLSSPGPIFYRQRRLGQSGKTFEIIKFRSMEVDAEKSTGAVWAKKDDPRITMIGRLLRKTRIDELPQLWNILKGEMAFVGPRAERPEFHNKLASEIPFYEERYLVKPGLTGWAQIGGGIRYTYSGSIAGTKEKLQYDLYYIKNRSLILDFGIILKTINIALHQDGR